MLEKEKKHSFNRSEIHSACYMPGFAAWYVLSGEDISVDTILNRVPSAPWRAAIFMLVLYAAKSLSVVFPIMVLYIEGGVLFPPVIALIINSAGALVGLIIGYLVGRVSGSAYIEWLIKKHSKVAEVIFSEHYRVL